MESIRVKQLTLRPFRAQMVGYLWDQSVTFQYETNRKIFLKITKQSQKRKVDSYFTIKQGKANNLRSYCIKTDD